MNLNDLLRSRDLDPQQVVVLRHRPQEPKLRKVLPWLAAERHQLFNAYQQTQREKLERLMQAMNGSGYVASFIGHEPGKALFVGLYSIAESKSLTYKQFWRVPAYVEMKAFGLKGWTRKERKKSIIWFNLKLTDFYVRWKGKLVIGWPGKERSWYRRAHKPNNIFPVLNILEESALNSALPQWDAIDWTWEDLSVLPKHWWSTLEQWRVIYFIFDASNGKGYVGSACGKGNLRSRWLDYKARGHGDNRLLRQRDPRHFRFT